LRVFRSKIPRLTREKSRGVMQEPNMGEGACRGGDLRISRRVDDDHLKGYGDNLSVKPPQAAR
jgi:hypothetical protein